MSKLVDRLDTLTTCRDRMADLADLADLAPLGTHPGRLQALQQQAAAALPGHRNMLVASGDLQDKLTLADGVGDVELF